METLVGQPKRGWYDALNLNGPRSRMADSSSNVASIVSNRLRA
ncbi:MAG: hypothetical protein R2745_08715 [Vicinamibacterales bacterium]